MKTIVIGLGNPYLTDDGVGVSVAWRVQSALPPSAFGDTTVTEASVGGVRLMEMMEGYDRVIIIDAITGEVDRRPGSFRKLSLSDLEEICATQHTASAHDTTLPTALAAGRKIGLSLPDEVIIFGVNVTDVSDFNDEPTSAVADAIPGIASAVLAELETDL